MKKILFRADAKPSIGIGDLMSLIHLSSYLDDNFECYYLTQATAAAKNIVQKFNLKNVSWIKEDASTESDVTEINRIINENFIDILFLEITEKKLTEYVGINSETKKICVNFDGHILDDIKLLINWDIAASKYYDVDKNPDTKFLFEPRYVILPKAFYAEKIQNRKYANVRKNILIAMGGADEFNFTFKVANALSDREYKLTIIIGAGYEKKEELIAFLDGKKMHYELKINVDDMLSEYLACDFAIGAGGLTSSELVASRTPCALIATYEHQIARCTYFDNAQWTKYLGFKEFNISELNAAIKSFNPLFSKNIFETQAIVDEIKRVSIG